MYRAILFIILSSCGTSGLYLKHYNKLNDQIIDGYYDDAEKYINESKSLYGEKSSFIYHGDKAIICLFSGKYKEAYQHVAIMEEILDVLFTKSVSRQIGSILTSDATLPYEGEDFEKVYVNVVGALSYSALGQYDDAIVEAKRADLKLIEITRRNKGGTYTEDGFIRFLMGLVYEDGGDINDAWISYMKAIQTYEKQQSIFGVPVPNYLLWRAVACGKELGFTTELESLVEKYNISLDVAYEKDMGRLVLINFAGRVPLKVEKRIEITLAQGLPLVQEQEISSEEQAKVSSALSVAKTLALGTNITFAIPHMQGTLPDTPPLDMWISGMGDNLAKSVLVENLGGIAYKCFEERLGRIWGKMVARAVIKYLLQVGAKTLGEGIGGEKWGDVIGYLMGATVGATLSAFDHADTRSWGTLPYEIRLAILQVMPGEYDVAVGYNQKEIARFNGVRVEPKRSQYLLLRTR